MIDVYEPTKTVIDWSWSAQLAPVLMHCRLLNGKEGGAGWG
jgi:hypothetical protein